ncbi:hypothetical protein ERJ75_001371600 [Trypanosoma vivax]|nr:hypothetical protein ERJ75_001371600 [Trypanosoma vivax]
MLALAWLLVVGVASATEFDAFKADGGIEKICDVSAALKLVHDEASAALEEVRETQFFGEDAAQVKEGSRGPGGEDDSKAARALDLAYSALRAAREAGVRVQRNKTLLQAVVQLRQWTNELRE